MKVYPFNDWVNTWLDKVEAKLAETLIGHTDMAVAITGHFRGVHGKRVRPALAILSAGLLGNVSDKTIALATGIELIHMATLVHDDVVDDAGMRRGIPTPNSKWGNNLAILTGDYLFAKAFTTLSDLDSPDIISALSRAVTVMCEGEWDQFKGRFDLGVDEDTYIRRISGKTASFMGCACECGAYMAGAGKSSADKLYDFGFNLGMAFQIVDDILDYEGDEDILGKPVAEDIASGVYTLPLILALSAEGVPGIRNELNNDVPDPSVIARLLRDSGTLEASRVRAGCFVTRAKDCLNGFEDSEHKTMLNDLADFVYTRIY